MQGSLRRVVAWVERPRAVVVMAALTLLVRLLGLLQPIRSDEAGFLLVAKNWQPGDPLGSTLVHSVYGPYFVDRPPQVIAFFGLTDLIGGPLFVRVVGAVACAVVVLLAAHGGRLVVSDEQAGRRAGGWAALLAAATLTTPAIDVVGVKGEVLGIPLVLGGALLAVHALRTASWQRGVALALASGLCGSLAVGFKQNLAGGLVFAGVLVLVAFATRRLTLPRASGLTTGLIVGAAVPVAVTWGWALVNGVDLHALWYAAVGFRGDASQVLADSSSTAPLERAAVLAGVALASGLVLVVGGFVVHAPDEWRDDPPLTAAVAAMLAVDTTGLVLSGSYWRDYLFALLPSAVLACALLARRRPSKRGRAMRTMVGLGVVSSLVSLAGWAGLQLAGIQPFPESDTANALRDASQPGDTLVVYGGHAEIQQMSGLPSPYPYLWTLPMRVLDPDRDQLIGLLSSSRRPTWFVGWIPLSSWDPAIGTRLEAVLARYYEPRGTACDGHPVWVVRGLDRPEIDPVCSGNADLGS
ncbi:hypothetical protein [Nocardioides acrostichi]|uniref:Uncharacterized protein n=1 Tax=Nocardioides acrostichi TaxID=2784339 RepID=A0A930Y5R7_9ACTN|nr:hypothetical protein [Nocardioides acrostichi]MBF4160161.1 hypothetical protein [Nocardioides acrostichi]